MEEEKEKAKKAKIANDKAMSDLIQKNQALQVRLNNLTADNKAIKLKAAQDVRKVEYDPNDWAYCKRDLTMKGFNRGLPRA